MDVEARIVNLIRSEIKVLRNLLSNLKNEQKALLSQNSQSLSEIFEERYAFLAQFENLSLNLIQHTIQLKADLNLNSEEPHHKALEALKTMIPVENMEFHSLLGQLEALFQEIDNQNNVTKYFLETGKKLEWNNRTAKNKTLLGKKQRKLQLRVLDPNEHQE